QRLLVLLVLEQKQRGPEIQIRPLGFHPKAGVQGFPSILESSQRVQDLSLQEVDITIAICDGNLLDLRQTGRRAQRVESCHREFEAVVNRRVCSDYLSQKFPG